MRKCVNTNIPMLVHTYAHIYIYIYTYIVAVTMEQGSIGKGAITIKVYR